LALLSFGWKMTNVLTDTDLDEIELSSEAVKVIAWRLKWLRAAGYSKRNAQTIAEVPTIDWRFACNLLKNTNDQELAMKILF
jgi:hypothetical protein